MKHSSYISRCLVRRIKRLYYCFGGKGWTARHIWYVELYCKYGYHERAIAACLASVQVMESCIDDVRIDLRSRAFLVQTVTFAKTQDGDKADMAVVDFWREHDKTLV